MPPKTAYREIQLTQGQVTRVSAHRYEELAQWLWQANWCSATRSFYAERSVRLHSGHRTRISMHRYILGLSYGDERQGDHQDHDTLNNTDDNLRTASISEAKRNQRKYRSNTSGFKGVSWHKQNKRWWAYIRVDGKAKSLGLYDTREEAHAAYCQGAIKYHGEFANFG